MKRKISDVEGDTKATRKDIETIKEKTKDIRKDMRGTRDDVKYLIKETKDMKIDIGVNASDTKYLIATTTKIPGELHLLGFCFLLNVLINVHSLKKLHLVGVFCIECVDECWQLKKVRR